MSRDGVTERAIELKADRIIVVNRWHEGTSKIKLFKVSSTGLRFVSPLILISEIRFRREFNEATRRSRASVITMGHKSSHELRQFARSLSQYFGLPILSMKVASTLHHVSMHFMFESSRQLQVTFMFLSRMVEIGPRLTVSRLIWKD
jgi:rRNA maturation protein Rpf1